MFRLKVYALAALAFIGGLIGVYLRGRSDAKHETKIEGLQDYVDTRRRMDEVDTGDDPAVLRDWLRERGKQ